MYVGKAASGVRAPWLFGCLGDGGNAGLPARTSNNGTGNGNWNGGVGAPGFADTQVKHYCILYSSLIGKIVL